MKNNESPPKCKSIRLTNQPSTPANKSQKCFDGKLTEPPLTEGPASDDSRGAASATKRTTAETNSTPEPSFSPFNELPVEIQRQIFEIAYRLSGQHRRRNDWVFICRKVREWIDPLIYEYITFPGDVQHHDRQRLRLFERTFRSKPKEFYSVHVRGIYTSHDLEYNTSDFEIELLSVCDNITSFECWSDYREELKNVLRAKSWPSLRTLCINIDLLPKDEYTFCLPIFQHITHLEFTSKLPQPPSWEGLQYLENLTHMRIFTLCKVRDFKEAMDHTHAVAVEAQKYFPPSLQYFVIIVPENILYLICNMKTTTREDGQRWSRMEDIRLGIFDARIVVGTCGYFENCEELDLDQGGVSNAMEYLTIVPPLRYPDRPRGNLRNASQNTWKEVAWSVRERKKMQELVEV